MESLCIPSSCVEMHKSLDKREILETDRQEGQEEASLDNDEKLLRYTLGRIRIWNISNKNGMEYLKQINIILKNVFQETLN